VLGFFKVVIMRSEINIFDGKRNPFTRAFEIAASVNEYAK
jgi:hypothetical protein